jgi:signal peptidase I
MSKINGNLIQGMQEELFRQNCRGWFRVVSGSMRPLLDINDRILAEKLSEKVIKPGDLILFKLRNNFVCHRALSIHKRNGKTFIFQKGDSAVYGNEIEIDSIIGTIVAIEKADTIYWLAKRRIRLFNSLLCLKNRFTYRFPQKFNNLKTKYRGKPGYIFCRTLYRILRESFSFFNRILFFRIP